MNIEKKIAEELSIELWQVEATVKLIDEGNTIPFIARYRKEAHGSLNDEQLRNLSERLTYLRNLEEKKEQVLSSIEEQGKLTEELKKKYTVVVVTHNMQQAVRVSDDTAFFLVGEMVEFADTKTIFSYPQDKRTEDYITGRFG